METLKNKLDAFDGNQNKVGTKGRVSRLVSVDKYIERIFRKNTCLPYMQ